MDSKPPLDEMLTALSNIHRRRLLVTLQEHNSQEAYKMHIPEDVPTDKEELEHLQIEMFHYHLPKLEEAGFIRWDKATETVAKGPRFEEIRPLLELLDNHADELPGNWS